MPFPPLAPDLISALRRDYASALTDLAAEYDQPEWDEAARTLSSGAFLTAFPRGRMAYDLFVRVCHDHRVLLWQYPTVWQDVVGVPEPDRTRSGA